MAHLFPAPPPGPLMIQGVQISTAVNTLPIPICYGTPRVAANLIWFNGFYASAVKNSAGKGLLTGGKGSTTSYNYFAAIIMAICEGPVSYPFIKFIDGTGWLYSTAYSSNGISVGVLGFYGGADNQ